MFSTSIAYDASNTGVYYPGPTAQQCQRWAADHGLIAFYARPTWLFCDFDQPEFRVPARILSIVNEFCLIQRTIRTISKSGHGFHFYVELSEPLPIQVRVGLQLSLGSDKVRETLTLTQDRSFITLYETPTEAVKLPYYLRSIFQATL